MTHATPRKPRIILVMQFYDPEPIYKGQRFAEAVAQAGYDVEVVTGFPNYPGGKVYDGYRIRPVQFSEINSIQITRVALFPSHDSSKIGRALNYLSFAFSAFVYLTFFARRANLVYVYSPPVTVGLAAALARIFRRFPLVVDIHDLWPDTLKSTGMLSSPLLLRTIDRACNWMYKQVQHIILHSEGFRDRLLERGVPREKMTAIIGWTDESAADQPPVTAPENLRSLPGLKLLYAGNIGPAQALDTVIEAANLLQQSGNAQVATFCFLGSGLSQEALAARAQELGLTNVAFLPRVSPSDVRAYLTNADALIVHLRDDPLFAITMPSKAQAYMLAGRPILMALHGEAAALIKTAQCGLTMPSEDPKALADAVQQLRTMSSDELSELGENARSYYWEHLCMEKGMARFAQIFEELRRP